LSGTVFGLNTITLTGKLYSFTNGSLAGSKALIVTSIKGYSTYAVNGDLLTKLASAFKENGSTLPTMTAVTSDSMEITEMYNYYNTLGAYITRSTTNYIISLPYGNYINNVYYGFYYNYGSTSSTTSMIIGTQTNSSIGTQNNSSISVNGSSYSSSYSFYKPETIVLTNIGILLSPGLIGVTTFISLDGTTTFGILPIYLYGYYSSLTGMFTVTSIRGYSFYAVNGDLLTKLALAFNENGAINTLKTINSTPISSDVTSSYTYMYSFSVSIQKVSSYIILSLPYGSQVQTTSTNLTYTANLNSGIPYNLTITNDGISLPVKLTETTCLPGMSYSVGLSGGAFGINTIKLTGILYSFTINPLISSTFYSLKVTSVSGYSTYPVNGNLLYILALAFKENGSISKLH
jgi:hypothetical protein